MSRTCRGARFCQRQALSFASHVPASRVPRQLTSKLACSSSDTSDVIPAGPDLQWRFDFRKHFVMGKHIGGGSFGQVYLGIDLHSGQEVAVKVMPKERGKLSRERTLQKLMTEVAILSALQECAAVARLVGYFEEEDQVLVVTEYCSGGDLQKIYEAKTDGLSERVVAMVALEALNVIKCCHDHGIVHGDVKPANFVLKSPQRHNLASIDAGHGPWLKAIDFGCSQIVDGTARLTKRTGTPVYMAPEIFQRDYSMQVDMWSLGVMLYQLFAGRFPFWEDRDCQATKLDEVIEAVLHTDVRYNYGPWHRITPQGRDFITGCLNRDQYQRLDIDAALTHPWFKRVLRPQRAASNGRAVAAAAAAGGGNWFARGAAQNNIVPSKQRVREAQRL